jgi:hypothetical protein
LARSEAFAKGLSVAMLALVATAIASCSLLVDVDSLGSGCEEGTKTCLVVDGTEETQKCVSKTDPDYGCGRTNCQPCALPSARAVCGPTGACVIASGVGTTEDCNDNPNDGCETDPLSSTAHCGSCEAPPCNVANATPDCANGRCVIRQCITGYFDCNERADDGCEVKCPSGQACNSSVCP